MSDNTLIPDTIRSQIGVGVLMSLGASDLLADRVHVPKPRYDTLQFNARILDKSKRKRVMKVRVVLDPSDTYSIKVTYPERGNPFQEVVHYEVDDVYCDQLAEILLRLDSVI
jgi:hypothetical protein